MKRGPTLPVIIVLIIKLGSCLGQSSENVSKVYDTILTLNPRVRPVTNAIDATQVFVSFHLTAVVNFDTVHQRLVSSGWFNVKWFNPFTVWDPEKYGGVKQIYPSPKRLWRPTLTVMNTLRDLKPVGEAYVVMIATYDGWITWLPAEQFETFCAVDVTFFPFDVQKCEWELFGWAEGATEVDLQLDEPDIELDTFRCNGEWDLINNSAKRVIIDLTDRSYPILKYEVTIRRRPSVLVLTILLPVFVLAQVNVFVFIIPSEAGERLSYSMTALLSFGVFMSFIVNFMPSASETVSIVALYMAFLLVLSSSYVLLCIMSVRLFYRDPSSHPIPGWLKTMIVWLEKLACLGPPTHNTTIKYNTKSHDVMKNDSLQTEVSGGRLKGHLDRWARRRKAEHEAYTEPKHMTWKRVSRSLDKMFFRFFFCLVLIPTIIISIALVNNYQSVN